jgi:hypothetical protein
MSPGVLVEVRLIAAEPSPAQQQAWRRLWILLLTGESATSGELAAREDMGNGQSYDTTDGRAMTHSR